MTITETLRVVTADGVDWQEIEITNKIEGKKNFYTA